MQIIRPVVLLIGVVFFRRLAEVTVISGVVGVLPVAGAIIEARRKRHHHAPPHQQADGPGAYVTIWGSWKRAG